MSKNAGTKVLDFQKITFFFKKIGVLLLDVLGKRRNSFREGGGGGSGRSINKWLN